MGALILFIAVIPWVYFWSLLPFRLLHALSSAVSIFFYHVFKYRRALVEENIKKAFPGINSNDIKTISQSFYKHFADLFIEILKGITMRNKEFKRRFEVETLEEIERILNSGKSVIIMAAHLNNWEWTSALSLYTKYPFYAIYQQLNNKYFDSFMRRNRARTGLHLLPTYLTKETLKQHQEDRKVALYGFLSDQSPTLKKTKLWTSYLSRHVPAHTGAEDLAREHDMAVFYMHLQKVKRSHYKASFTLLTDNVVSKAPFQITKDFLALAEQSIHQQPEYYLWTHRRFKHEKPL
ncbi:MAG: lysophospholipid acyltransferase family protein [Bacteroidetes bacterium]|nr:lysophospholipid acyltransferase family protein [Bacteroidota bacterium]